MRLRIAYDRTVRTLYKSVRPRPGPSSPLSSPRSPRQPNSHLRVVDLLILAVSLLFLLYAIITLCRDKRYHPLKHYRIGNGVSVILACNTTSALRRSLDSVGNLPKSVAVPLGFELDGGIKVAGDWNANAATNLAASRAHAKWLLLLPCGCAMPVIPDHLTDGRIAYVSENDSAYSLCSSTILVRTKEFFAVRGLDERASAQGDISFRRRLHNHDALLQYKLELPSSGSEALTGIGNAVALAADEMLGFSAPPWNDLPSVKPRTPTDPRVTELARTAASYHVVGGVYYPSTNAVPLAAFKQGYSDADKIQSYANNIAYQHVLTTHYQLPTTLTNGMNGETMKRLLDTLSAEERRNSVNIEQKYANGDAMVAEEARKLAGSRELRPKFLAIEPMHGLGNRLRAVASARALARATRRVLIVVWTRDPHCLARWSDLFSPMRDVFVTGVGPAWPLFDRVEHAWAQWSIFDYMDENQKDSPIDTASSDHILVRSAYVLHAKISWADTNAELRSLSPSAAVAKYVTDAESEAGAVREAVGVHVRARNVDGEIKGASYTANATTILRYWRKKSSPSVFIPEMKTGVNYVVAADSEEARNAMSKVRGAVVLKGCDSRSAKCVQRAMAEMLVLARTKELLASPWSSFSEAVARLGGLRMRVAGVDFGADDSAIVRQAWGDNVADVVEEVHRRREEKSRIRALHSQ